MQRSPWFNLVDYHPPDAFFTYMSWAAPKIVLNWTQADCTNAMHRLYWTELGQTTKPEAIALSMLSSVVQLQIEMYGRSYGGGVLKMEPRQVRSLWLPQLSGEIADLFAEVCKLLKRGESGAVTRLVDAAIDERLGISADKLQSLRQEFTRLRARRLRRKGSVLRPAGRPHDTVQGRGA